MRNKSKNKGLPKNSLCLLSPSPLCFFCVTCVNYSTPSTRRVLGNTHTRGHKSRIRTCRENSISDTSRQACNVVLPDGNQGPKDKRKDIGRGEKKKHTGKHEKKRGEDREVPRKVTYYWQKHSEERRAKQPQVGMKMNLPHPASPRGHRASVSCIC